MKLCEKCKGPNRRKLGHTGMHAGAVYPFQEARRKKLDREHALIPAAPAANGTNPIRTAKEAIAVEIELCDSRKALLANSLSILEKL